MPEQNGTMNEPERLKGVFSTTRSQKIGTGATQRRIQQTFNYYAEEMEDGVVEVQPLGDNWLPVGHRERISKEELLADFLPEPALYQKEVLPRLRDVQKAVARGDKYRRRGESFTAEFEYNKALDIDEKNVRANFGIGLCYVERGEEDKAREVFERVVTIEAAFDDEHKHLFNEFGISLRKQGMFKEAAEYYRRALELSASDENLHYNLARALFELGEARDARSSLKRCLDLAPDHAEAKTFLEYLDKKQA